MSTSSSNPLKDTLQSYLEGQRVAGHQKLAWNDVPPSKQSGTQAPPPPPPAPAPPPPLDKAAPRPTLPAAPEVPALVKPTAPRIFWMEAHRHPECVDAASEAAPSILVVSDEEEFLGESGTLLKEMLHAIGFIAAEESHHAEAGFPSQAARVLVMGNHALQSISKAGVDLQLIRGLWQSLEPGRTLATYAPSAVIDSPSGKKTVWGDLQTLLEDLSLEVPEWTRKRLKRT